MFGGSLAPAFVTPCSIQELALTDLFDFLYCPTPVAWLEYAANHLDLLLIDHAHCERKAATTAIQLISKYPDKAPLVNLMSPLAREELLHFEKVVDLMAARDIKLIPLPPSNYAQAMHRKVTSRDMVERLRDYLIIGAIIEARSCERFHALIPYLQDAELRKFYQSLFKAEARHFQDYLQLARHYGGEIEARLALFLSLEQQLIESPDQVFRFHSGIPVLAGVAGTSVS